MWLIGVADQIGEFGGMDVVWQLYCIWNLFCGLFGQIYHQIVLNYTFNMLVILIFTKYSS